MVSCQIEFIKGKCSSGRKGKRRIPYVTSVERGLFCPSNKVCLVQQQTDDVGKKERVRKRRKIHAFIRQLGTLIKLCMPKCSLVLGQFMLWTSFEVLFS